MAGSGLPSRPPLAEPGQTSGGVSLPPAPPATYPSPFAETAPAQPKRRSKGRRGGLWLAIVVAALVGALVAGGLVFAFGGRGTNTKIVQASGAGGRLNIKSILAAAQPSVVSIVTGAQNSLYGEAGSGFVVSKDGLIITNNHVIAGADKIQVQFNDGSTAPASLVGSFPDNDIAMIRVAGRTDLVPAKLGSSTSLQVGDDVVAIGNALNLGGDPSVTLGIVSAKERTIDAGTTTLEHLIQTDAAINPGNSGGPLVNASGQVVGINTAIIKDAQNIGFSISLDSVKPLIDQLKAGKGAISPNGAFLGVVSSDVSDPSLDPAVLRRYGVTASSGAFVTKISAGSPAEKAGIKEGDVIVSIGGTAITGTNDVGTAVRAHKPGDTVPVIVERSGQRQTIAVTLTRRGG